METKEYRTADKSTWGDGPWQDEPDKMQFPDPVTGLPCLIVRNPYGALCGYVGVTEGHPFYKKGGYDFNLSVHGGITFTAMCSPGDDEEHGICHLPGEGESDHVWWLGFDCAHYSDKSPKMVLQFPTLDFPDDVYRDIDYVKSEIASLAQQLHALS